MNRLRYLAVLLIIVIVSLLNHGIALAYSSGSLTTIFASDNMQDGNMFDIITAGSEVTIESFDINFGCLPTGESTVVAVYYKSGTYSGYETNPGAWTLLGSSTVKPESPNTPTPLPVGGLVIPANTTFGIYITNTSIDSPNFYLGYTDGTGTWSDDFITITHGTGNRYPFGATFQPRIWNGTVYYSTVAYPGLDQGNKKGWDGSLAPGLDKTGKTPLGFTKGNKSGWSDTK